MITIEGEAISHESERKDTLQRKRLLEQHKMRKFRNWSNQVCWPWNYFVPCNKADNCKSSYLPTVGNVFSSILVQSLAHLKCLSKGKAACAFVAGTQSAQKYLVYISAVWSPTHYWPMTFIPLVSPVRFVGLCLTCGKAWPYLMRGHN